jgi:hypothetical protein
MAGNKEGIRDFYSFSISRQKAKQQVVCSVVFLGEILKEERRICFSLKNLVIKIDLVRQALQSLAL